MNETILAYNLGYRVNKSGELYLGGVPINYEEFTSFLLK